MTAIADTLQQIPLFDNGGQVLHRLGGRILELFLAGTAAAPSAPRPAVQLPA